MHKIIQRPIKIHRDKSKIIKHKINKITKCVGCPSFKKTVLTVIPINYSYSKNLLFF